MNVYLVLLLTVKKKITFGLAGVHIDLLFTGETPP